MRKHFIEKKLIKMLGAIILGGMMLNGCASSEGNAIRYYSLNNNSSVGVDKKTSIITISPNEKHAYLVGIKQVLLPEALDSQALVYRISEQEVIQTERHKWVSGLKDQLTLSLVSELRQNGIYALNGGCSAADGSTCAELVLNVTDFSGSYVGEANVSFDWTLRRDSSICRGAIQSFEPMNGDGYEELVKAMNKAWEKNIVSLASELKKCH